MVFNILNIIELNFNLESIGGRPEKSFLDSSRSSKYRKINEVLETNSPNRIIAAGMQLISSPEHISKKTKLGSSFDSTVTPDEAISLISDMQISKRQYGSLLKLMEKKDMTGFFPSKKRILAREKELLPPNKLHVTKYKADIDVSFVVLSTLKSIIDSNQQGVKELLLNSARKNVEFCFKLGTYRNI